MKEYKTKKKAWSKPIIKSLKIKKDTFAGSIGGKEAFGKGFIKG